MKDPSKSRQALTEELYASLVDAIPDHIVCTDQDGKILFVNDRVLRISGYSRGEMEGQSLLAFIAPEDRQRVIQNMPFITEGRVKPEEYKIIMKDGNTVPFDVNGGLLRDEDGAPFGMVYVCRDIRERSEAEELSRQSEEKFHKVFMTTPDCVVIARMKDGLLMDANKGYEDILGWKRENVVGKSMADPNFDFWVDLPDRGRMWEGLKAGRDILHRELKFRRSDGSVRTGIYSARPIQIADEACFVFILQDITDRKRVEEDFRRTLESLRNAVGVTIRVMVSAVEARDPYTAGHQVRCADLARAIATEMGLSQDRIAGIRMAGSIHDIGKLSIPAEILSKPTQLTELEYSLIQEHPRKGYEMLKDVESPWPLAEIVFQHHERMDGSGYPRQLKRDDILMEARIMAVADVVESTASHRPYRPALGVETALDEIEKNKGILYDDAVADACLRLFRKNGYQLPLNESVHFMGNMHLNNDTT
jgi:PAS domain S-box-containing protein